MRAAAALIVLLGAGMLAGHALADTVSLPPVPTVPTPPTPPVVVPLPPIPKLPAPALPAPGPVPTPSSTPAVPPVPSVASVAGSSLVAGSSAGSQSSAPGTESSAPGTGSDRTRVKGFHSSRRWIATTGPKRRRVTTLTFVLPQAARVLFVVKQVSPVCRIAGRFAVNGRAGRNRVRFPGRASKLQLDPGTYRITARTAAGGVVRRVTIVVVDGGAPTRDQIVAARASNVCTAAGRRAANGSTGASNTNNVSSSPQEVQRSLTPAARPSASGPTGVNSHSGAVLASSIERTARAVRPALVALLALAIVLLGIASLPRVAFAESRANELLARHRMEIAGLGTAAFVAVVVAFLLG